jgi:hypothetical protein
LAVCLVHGVMLSPERACRVPKCAPCS